MQIAGEKCKICSTNILMASDATWCARCRTTVHKSCLEARDGMCPGCAQPIDLPESHFYFSKACPECGARNQPPKEKCTNCGCRTQWDTEAEYQEYCRRVRAEAKGYIVAGAATIGLAGVVGAAYLIALALLIQRGGWFISGAVIAAVVYLLGYGIKKIADGISMRNFE